MGAFLEGDREFGMVIVENTVADSCGQCNRAEIVEIQLE